METFRILVAEPDDSRFETIHEAFNKHDEGHFVVNVNEGKLLLQHLSGKIKYNFQLPDLLLLNSDSSEVEGRQPLELIKANPLFRTIPTVVYTWRADQKIKIDRTHAGVRDVESRSYASSNPDLFVAELINFLTGAEPGGRE